LSVSGSSLGYGLGGIRRVGRRNQGGRSNGILLGDDPTAPVLPTGPAWLVLAGDAAVDGGDPLPANSCIFVGPEDPAFAGASGPVGAELLCLQFRRRARD